MAANFLLFMLIKDYSFTLTV